MKKSITFCTSLAFLLGISSGANAGLVSDFTSGALSTITPSFGTLGVPDSKGTVISPALNSTITHQLIFDLATAPALLIAGTLVTGAGFLTVSGGGVGPAVVTLFQEKTAMAGMDPPVSEPAFTPVVATFSTDGVNDVYSISTTLTMAVPTRFFIDVDADTGPGGIYSLQLTTLLPIPLPPAAVLFLSALAGLAGFSRIRRRKRCESLPWTLTALLKVLLDLAAKLCFVYG